MPNREDENEPTEEIARRAVELWKRMLKVPKFDNGAKDGFSSMLAGMAKNNSTPEILEKFGQELLKRILDKSTAQYIRTVMHVDYGPDQILDDSAKAAGLKTKFP